MRRARRRTSDGWGPEEGAGPEVVLVRVGTQRFAIARGTVRAIRPSPRVTGARATDAARGVPLVSLSAILGIERDVSVDARVVEVLHWGERLGLEVTAIEGIRRLRPEDLHALPPALERAVASRAVLGVAELEDGRAIVLDVATLLVERGVEIG